jgi:predicted ATP-grasp superfamily ATP-dependent carboligase
MQSHGGMRGSVLTAALGAALAAALVLAACGAGSRGPRTQVPASARVEQDPETGDELICQDERMTGTNVSRSVCRTQAEIDEERNAAMTWEKRPRNNTGR